MSTAKHDGGLLMEPPVSPAKRGETKNVTDARGQFGMFLRHWIDTEHDGDESELAKRLCLSPRAIRKWCEGTQSPPLGSIDEVARAMGYADWIAMAAAVGRFLKRQK